MKRHLCVVWEQDMAVSVIGPEVEQLFKIYQYYPNQVHFRTGPWTSGILRVAM